LCTKHESGEGMASLFPKHESGEGMASLFKNSMRRIKIKDYIRMGKARGLRLPIQYFFQNHLFDIIRGTDTHFRLDKDDYEEHPEDFETGVLYMSSVTKEVKNALKFVKKESKDSFFDYQFFDLGCGKGKTILIYSESYGRKAMHKTVGIDYYKPLTIIAQKNLELTRNTEYALAVHDDARNFAKYCTSSRLIIYLYNPFGANIVRDILESSQKQDVYLIYTDPEFQDLVIEKDFKLIFSKKGNYPNRTTSIFFRRGL